MSRDPVLLEYYAPFAYEMKRPWSTNFFFLINPKLRSKLSTKISPPPSTFEGFLKSNSRDFVSLNPSFQSFHLFSYKTLCNTLVSLVEILHSPSRSPPSLCCAHFSSNLPLFSLFVFFTISDSFDWLISRREISKGLK